jgi:aspartate aminotransferase
MAEQKAVAKFLAQEGVVDDYFVDFKKEVEYRLHHIYEGFVALKNEGFAVDAIVPQAAIYLTVQINLAGKKAGGKLLQTQADVTAFILDEAKLAIVPFNCFGAKDDSSWYRISVGCVKKEEITEMLGKLKAALQKVEAV